MMFVGENNLVDPVPGHHLLLLLQLPGDDG